MWSDFRHCVLPALQTAVSFHHWGLLRKLSLDQTFPNWCFLARWACYPIALGRHVGTLILLWLWVIPENLLRASTEEQGFPKKVSLNNDLWQPWLLGFTQCPLSVRTVNLSGCYLGPPVWFLFLYPSAKSHLKGAKLLLLPPVSCKKSLVAKEMLRNHEWDTKYLVLS